MDEKFCTVRGYELQKENKELLTSALEDYLEMIYRNSLNHSYIRVSELANLLNVKDSSASKMVKKLKDLGYINYEKYGIVTLTDEGEEMGKVLLDRHNIIEKFLTLIGCESELLVQVEIMEHIVNGDTVENIKQLCNFFYNNEDIREKYNDYKKNNLNNNV